MGKLFEEYLSSLVPCNDDSNGPMKVQIIFDNAKSTSSSWHDAEMSQQGEDVTDTKLCSKSPTILSTTLTNSGRNLFLFSQHKTYAIASPESRWETSSYHDHNCPPGSTSPSAIAPSPPLRKVSRTEDHNFECPPFCDKASYSSASFSSTSQELDSSYSSNSSSNHSSPRTGRRSRRKSSNHQKHHQRASKLTSLSPPTQMVHHRRQTKEGNRPRGPGIGSGTSSARGSRTYSEIPDSLPRLSHGFVPRSPRGCVSSHDRTGPISKKIVEDYLRFSLHA